MSLEESISKLFGPIKCQLILVQDGQIAMNISGKQQGTYQTNRTDLRIAGLEINPLDSPHIRVADIALRLKETSMITPDSLYKMDIKDFGIEGNTLICKNATFAPTSYNKTNSGLYISIPSFKLLDISLVDLLEKRLKASSGLIDGLVLNITAGPRKKETVETGVWLKEFYQMLHGFAQLVAVDRLRIQHGKINYSINRKNATRLSANELDAEIKLSDLLSSSSLLTSKLSVPYLNIGEVTFQSGNLILHAKGMKAKGDRQTNSLHSFTIQLPSGLHLEGEEIFWKQFSWDSMVISHKIVIDSIDFKKLNVASGNMTKKEPSKKAIHLPLAIRRIRVHKSDLNVTLSSGAEAKAKGNDIFFDSTQIIDGRLSWKNISTTLNDLSFADNRQRITADKFSISNRSESLITNIQFDDATKSISIPEIRFLINVREPGIKDLHLNYFTINRPDIAIDSRKATIQQVSKRSSTTTLPKIDIDHLEINEGSVWYASAKNLALQSNLKVKIDSFSIGDSSQARLKFRHALIDADSITVKTKNFPMEFSKASMTADDGAFTADSSHEYFITALINAQCQLNSFSRQNEKSSLSIKTASGYLNDYTLKLKKGNKIDISSLLNKIDFEIEDVQLKDSAITLTTDKIKGQGSTGIISFDRVKLNPNIDKQEFFKTSEWQKDYVTFSSENIAIENFDTRLFIEDTAIRIQKIFLQDPVIASSRDKNIAFLNGIEKLMPTKLVAAIKKQVRIDSIQIANASIEVHEVSKSTKKEGTIPITHLNAVIKNLDNSHNNSDSLVITANGMLLDYHIRRFRYAESYADSLSGFRMRYRLSPMDLREISKVTVDMAAVAVTSGRADTLYARITGNKYAAFGEMNFPYRALHIKFLDKKDTAKKNIMKGFQTFVANSFVVKTRGGRKQSRVFYIRDQEKFVFNYWVKALLSGILTSAGVKSNKKYETLYNDLKSTYSLPELD